MSTPVAIDTEQRRLRLARRHHLLRPATTVERVATDLVGIHSSDPATVHLAARARVRRFETETLEHALYEDRTVVRMLGMRRTMFVIDRDGAAVMDAACTQALVAGERKRLVGLIEAQGVATDGRRWLARVMRRTLGALDARGEATASELSKDVPELRVKLSMGEGKKWAGTVGMSTRVLFLLATEGAIVRGRPNGGWTSSQYRWAKTEHWLGASLTMATPPARVELARRWLAAYGPGTLRDLCWWTGWSQRVTRHTLGELGACEVTLDEGAGYVLPDDVGRLRVTTPWVALLPGLDPTVMGWKDRDWYLDPRYAARLFDGNGNAGPTVWSNGRVIGGWAQRADGTVATELLEPVDRSVQRSVDHQAAALTEWLGKTLVIPRFRTPLERSLAAGK